MERLRRLERDLVDGDLAWLPQPERTYLLKVARRRIRDLQRTTSDDASKPPSKPLSKPP